MKTSLISLVGAVAIGAALPAPAGPDWQAIERARAQKKVQVAQPDKPRPDAKCTTKYVPLLDHGPRAQTTPYLERQRRAQFDAERPDCARGAAKGPAQ